jgi:hypothetical protein
MLRPGQVNSQARDILPQLPASWMALAGMGPSPPNSRPGTLWVEVLASDRL